MSDAEIKTERRTRRQPSKANRVIMTIPPHIRMFVDTFDKDYVDLILKALEATGASEVQMKEIWKRHCQETIASGGETSYCWRGMRMDW